MSNFTDSELNEIKEIVKSQLQAKSSKEELRTKSKREIYFEQFNKIADVELREKCKELYDDDFTDKIPNCVRDAICGMFRWRPTEEGTTFWSAISNRTDLETNPYIISKWKPEVGGEYYIPNPKRTNKYYKETWVDDSFDRCLHERGLVFRTPEEAIEATDKMLEAINK